ASCPGPHADRAVLTSAHHPLAIRGETTAEDDAFVATQNHGLATFGPRPHAYGAVGTAAHHRLTVCGERRALDRALVASQYQWPGAPARHRDPNPHCSVLTPAHNEAVGRERHALYGSLVAAQHHRLGASCPGPHADR